MNLKEIPKKFFDNTTIDVAKGLLGKYLVRKTPDGVLIGKIVETEAYLHDDPASHSYKGKTKRNAPMFEKSGTSYVYFTYGMYHCMNIVTNKKEIGEAVLIRAVEPVQGVEIMKKNRKKIDEKNLCNGPAKLTIAFDIDKNQNGVDILLRSSKLRIMQGFTEDVDVVSTQRIGISNGKELFHRFYIKDNSYVSKK